MAPEILIDRDDVRLMLAFQGGREDALELLLQRHRTPLVFFLYRMVQDAAVAEELAQEAFLRVHLARASYRPTAEFTTWLYRIATNRALNWLRDHRREKGSIWLDTPGANGLRRELKDHSPTIEGRLEREDLRRLVRGAVMGLPERQRAAVLMHKYDELDYSQIAGALGCTVSAVKALLFRAYERLRVQLEPALIEKDRSLPVTAH